jgi:hypothetical protein
METACGALTILSSEYDYLASTGFWFKRQVFGPEARDRGSWAPRREPPGHQHREDGQLRKNI